MGHPNVPAGGGRPPGGGPRPDTSALADYQGALLPGRYPPLGYAPDGTALYQPGQPPPAPPSHTPTNRPGPQGHPAYAGGQPPAGPPGAVPPPDGAPSGPGKQPARAPGVGATAIALALAGVVLLGAIVVGGAMLRSESPQADAPETTIDFGPPTGYQQPPVVPGPNDPGTGPHGPGGGQPGQGGLPGGGGTQAGKAVSYEVTIDGTGTILYVDDQGVRSEFAPTPTWRVSFTATSNPLRVMVIAGGRSSVSCEIKVEGATVAADRVTSDSSRRTASCLA